ncbi:MAG: response regulator [Syntrophobacteraceae bacterium]
MKILVVDDTEEARYLLVALLRGFGYEVETAENGAEALKMARKAPPDLIVADILMPVMDGFTLCLEWKKDERLRSIPFIFYTATYTEPRDREFALGLGADRFIVKPEAPATFIAIVRETIEKVKNAPSALSEASRQHPCQSAAGGMEEGEVCLKQYNEVLIRKLEAKMEQLEQLKGELERDIAERMRLTTAIEQITEGIVINDVNWVIQYVNSGIERITGYDRREMIGRPGAMLSDDSTEGLAETIREAILRDGVWSGRMLNRKKDGTLFHAEVTISPVRNASGAITDYVSVIRDVTHEVNIEKSLRQAEKMECIGTLAGGIAHDFNNILMAMMGCAELARSLASGNEPLEKNLDQILAAGVRAKELVGRILTFSRQKEQERRPLQLAPVVTEAIKLLRASLPSTIEIRREIAGDAADAVILSDPTQMHQVVMNLAVNAAHAMRACGGVLSIGVRKMEVDAKVLAQHPDLRQGPYACIDVSDTGCGMDDGIRERIFDPYFTTKEAGEGTGLGLSVVHNIVLANGGHIEVESSPGRGTVFHLWFPALQEAKTPSVEPAQEPATGHERILFVDDEELLIELGKAMLEPLGYTVRTEQSSPEALEVFQADPGGFDLVITDMTMPGITGMELAAKIQDIRPDIPIILCTGFGADTVVKQCVEEKNCRVVMKPYSRVVLAKAVRRALDRK